MKNFTNDLATELHKNLEKIELSQSDGCECAKASLKVVLATTGVLKDFIKNQCFATKQDEIIFFKELKPQFSSKLIYFSEMYRIEITKPIGSHKNQIKHYKLEQKRIEKFYALHSDFYKYYRTGSKHLDKVYFTRSKFNLKVLMDCNFFQNDAEFTTSHDFLLSRIIASEELQKYIKQQIEKVQEVLKSRREEVIKKVPQLNWTGSKVALVELLYALHASGVVNNGTTTLTSLANAFEQVFNLKIPQFNRVFLEIKNRKSIEQTAFLNQLRNDLARKIEESEK